MIKKPHQKALFDDSESIPSQYLIQKTSMPVSNNLQGGA